MTSTASAGKEMDIFMKKFFMFCIVATTALLLAACSEPNTFSDISDGRISTETTFSETTVSSEEQNKTSSTGESTDGTVSSHSESLNQQIEANQEAADSQETATTANSSDTVSSSGASTTTAPKTTNGTRPSLTTRPSQSSTTVGRPSSSSTSAVTTTKTTVAPVPVDKADQVAALVNAERAKAGLSALALDKELSANATVRAEEIVNNFSHTRPNGASFSSAITISYRRAGENIAYGYPTAEAVMDGWMNSSGHRANILQSSFTKIGVGVVQRGNTLYWVQLFTG